MDNEIPLELLLLSFLPFLLSLTKLPWKEKSPSGMGDCNGEGETAMGKERGRLQWESSGAAVMWYRGRRLQERRQGFRGRTRNDASDDF
jgi:hypothetical protein